MFIPKFGPLKVDQLRAVKSTRLALCAKPIDTHFSQHDTAHRHAAMNATNKALLTSGQTCNETSMLQMPLYRRTSPKMDVLSSSKPHHKPAVSLPPASSIKHPDIRR